MSREPYATIALRPGVERPGVETAPERRPRRGLDRTGWPATMESAVRSGRRAAQHILSSASQQHSRRGSNRTDRLDCCRLDRAIDRGTQRLLELQRPDGVWAGELESNVTMTAQHLFWHHYLGLRTPELDRRIANELMARMRDDGTWSIWFEGPPDLSTSIEAYVACASPASTRGQGARVHPAPGRDPEGAPLHEVLHGPHRPVAVAEDAADPA